jgi:hypothetical protein
MRSMKWKRRRAPIEDEPRTIAILHIGRMDDDVQQEAERIDEDVPLAARDLLARIVATMTASSRYPRTGTKSGMRSMGERA